MFLNWSWVWAGKSSSSLVKKWSPWFSLKDVRHCNGSFKRSNFRWDPISLKDLRAHFKLRLGISKVNLTLVYFLPKRFFSCDALLTQWRNWRTQFLDKYWFRQKNRFCLVGNFFLFYFVSCLKLTSSLAKLASIAAKGNSFTRPQTCDLRGATKTRL